MSRQDEAREYDEFREVAEQGYQLNAWEFRQWLRSHYEDAANPVECLTALVATIYGGMGRVALDLDIEPEDLAAMFDDAVCAVDEAGAHHALLHVTEAGNISSLQERKQIGASTGARALTWLKYTAIAAADDAKDMVAEKHNPPAGHPAAGLEVER